MNTDAIIKNDLADIESIRVQLLAEGHSASAAQSGVEQYAKGVIEDLSSFLGSLSGYQPIADCLSARIAKIRKVYGVSK